MSNLGIDLDGVVADFTSEFSLRMKEHGYTPDMSNWMSHDLVSNHPEMSQGWIDEQFLDEKLIQNFVPYDDAWYMMNKWQRDGHKTYIITSRPISQFQATLDWLDDWHIDFSSLFCGAKKNEKSHYVANLELDIFIEDNPIQASLISDLCTSYFLDRDGKGSYDWGDAIRVESMREIKV